MIKLRETLFNQIDKNNDGVIDKDEFDQYANKKDNPDNNNDDNNDDNNGDNNDNND